MASRHSIVILLASVCLLLTGCARSAPAGEAACAAMDAELRPLLHASWSGITAAGSWRASWQATRRSIESMLVSHDEWVALGWCDLRAGRMADAAEVFGTAQNRVRHSVDATIGLAFVALRQDRPGEATRLFAVALQNAPTSIDAREGMHLALQRLGDGDAAAVFAAETLGRIADRHGADAEAIQMLAIARRRAGGAGAP